MTADQQRPEPETDPEAPPAAPPVTPADREKARATDDLLIGLLPRVASLSTLVQRGRLTEYAMEEAGLAIDRPGMTVMLTLHLSDRPLRVGEIATRMQVVGPHITRQLNVLEKQGLVRRVTDPQDSRARLIEATARGKEAAQRYVTVLLGWFTEAMADWSEQDRQDLGRLLGRFADDVTDRLRAFEGEQNR